MAEMEMRVETRADAAAKMAAMMGTDQPSVFEIVDRSKYATDDAYLDALVKAEMERSSPEYQEARRRLKRQYMERQSRRSFGPLWSFLATTSGKLTRRPEKRPEWTLPPVVLGRVTWGLRLSSMPRL